MRQLWRPAGGQRVHYALAWLVAFASSVAIEFVIARWNFAIHERKALPAVSYAVLFRLLQGASLVVFLDSYWAILPCVVGDGVGTWLVVKLTPKRNSQCSG
jgi:hypothetical protein